MENNEILTSNPAAPVAPTEVPLTGGVSASKKPINKKLILVIAAVVLLLGVAAAVYFLVIKPNSSKSATGAGTSDDASQIDPSVPAAAVEVMWTDEEADNSGDRYIEYQEEIINGSASADEKFTAQLVLANYNIAIRNFDAAEERLLSLDTSDFSTEDFFRYYNVLTHLYDESGDNAKRDEYNALSVEYRNRLITEEGSD